jgi:transposase
MKRTTKHVGLDVHQATTIAVVREDTGRLIQRSVLATEATAIREFFRGMRGTIRVAFEEGTQAQWLHDLLVPLVSEVVVCDRRGEPQRGNKGDDRDAAQLSERLRQGALRPVYHGGRERAPLKELVRTYQQVVDDSTRVMARLKALFRGRAIPTKGRRVYDVAERGAWLAQLTDPGARFRATVLYAQLEVLLALRPQAKAAMAAAAQRDPAWAVLRSIPFLGPVRVAMLLATVQTPWRFRTKRQLWAYAGLAVVTRTTAEYELAQGRPVRRRRAPMTRGLNRNHNRFVKAVFKGAAQTASGKRGPFQEFYQGMLNRGMRPELATVTLARKLAAVTLRLWKTGEAFDASQLTIQQVAAR